MFPKSLPVTLPRRVVAYYLLFGLLAVAWLSTGIFYVSSAVLQSRSEQQTLALLDRTTRSLALDYLKHQDKLLQESVEKVAAENALAYVAIVDAAGKYLAHSQRGQIGSKAREPSGEAQTWGQVQRVRMPHDDETFLLEYRGPLVAGGTTVGWVRLGKTEARGLRAWLHAAPYAPLALLTPLLLMAIGAAVVGRLVRPLSEIDRQLREAAVAPSMSGFPLEEVKVSGPASIGWNRVVDQHATAEGGQSLEKRLSHSLQDVRARKLERVLNSLTDGVALTDREGKINYANAAVIALLDRRKSTRRQREDTKSSEESAEKEEGGDWLEFTMMREWLSRGWELPDDSPLLAEESSQRNVTVELERLPGGNRRVLRVTRGPLRFADGSSGDTHVWTFRDVTQQKLAEEMRNQFVDTATHELRTPLANIKAYAETLALSDVIDVEQQKEFLNTINSEATRLARFVDDLLSVSSMEVGSLSLSRSTTDLERLLGEVVNKVRPQMTEKNLTFEHQFPEKFPEPTWDKDKMSATIVNLLGNAAKYTPDGGRVALRVRTAEDNVEISIEDTGIGIAEEEIPRLFDKFFRSDDPRVHEQTGTGLGLALAHEVIRLHGGKITVDSELNKGTTFLVTVPLS